MAERGERTNSCYLHYPTPPPPSDDRPTREKTHQPAAHLRPYCPRERVTNDNLSRTTNLQYRSLIVHDVFAFYPDNAFSSAVPRFVRSVKNVVRRRASTTCRFSLAARVLRGDAWRNQILSCEYVDFVERKQNPFS